MFSFSSLECGENGIAVPFVICLRHLLMGCFAIGKLEAVGNVCDFYGHIWRKACGAGDCPAHILAMCMEIEGHVCPFPDLVAGEARCPRL